MGFHELEFPFSEQALEVNDVMPLVTLDKVEDLLGGLSGKRMLLLGVSYREGVADTRESPAATFIAEAEQRGAEVVAQDPLVSDMGEGQADGCLRLPDPDGFDAVVFAVAALAIRRARRAAMARRRQAARPRRKPRADAQKPAPLPAAD